MSRPVPITRIGLREIEMIAGRQIDTANAKSALDAILGYGFDVLGLSKPHRLAHVLSQAMHESMSFRYDRELWGPTPAQKRYDTRTDLGNTAAADGDGSLYRGRAGVQITGKANYTAFTKWAKKIDKNAPDFVKNPDLVNTDPWEGLALMWYWETRQLNSPADVGQVRAVTKIINGGYNGLDDRLRLYTRVALVLLGYGPDDVTRFQMDAGLKVDGVAGDQTRAALHRTMLLAKPLEKGSAKSAEAPVKKALPAASTSAIIAAILAAIGGAYTYFFGG